LSRLKVSSSALEHDRSTPAGYFLRSTQLRGSPITGFPKIKCRICPLGQGQETEHRSGRFSPGVLQHLLMAGRCTCSPGRGAPTTRRSTVQTCLVVLALLATVWSCCGDIYPIKERRRTREAKCFDDAQDELKPLAYGGGKSISIAYQDWSSSR
jgi:hypothetical protein